jgi:hypothetical protein
MKNPKSKPILAPPKTEIEIPVIGSGLIKDEVSSYFKIRQARIKPVLTTQTKHGQILDWVPIKSQNPKGVIATPPSASVDIKLPKDKNKVMQLMRFELEEKDAQRGPEGTIPILRKDLEKLPRYRSLDRYLSKHCLSGQKLAVRNGLIIAMPEDGGTHRYADTHESINCFGGEGYLSAYDPYVEASDDFSLLQIGLSNSNSSGQLQTVEAGWQEFQDLYGDWVPHLFLFYTTNGYTDQGDNKGGYNQDVDGWVQYDDSVYPGAISSPNSLCGGAQYVMFIKFQLYQGNWWFQCNGRWLGYYPASLFYSSGLGDHASSIGFWGEIFDSGTPFPGRTTTDMGSGCWPNSGWPWSAYMSNLRIQSKTDGTMDDYNGSGWASDPSMYNLITHMRSGTSWGNYFWLGGPGSTGIINKITLGDTSPAGPALASLNGRLYLGWRGDGNTFLNVMYSSDNGQTFGQKHTSSERSSHAPALCAHNGKLYTAWKGDGNDNLNVAEVIINGNNITGLSNKVTLGDTSPVGPTLASLNGRLYLGWRGDGNTYLNVMYSSDNGRTFGNKHTSSERSDHAPSLCSHNGKLFISWKGDGNDHLNVAEVIINGTTIASLSNKTILGDTSLVGPTLTSFNSKLYLGWRGDGNTYLNVMNSSDNGHSFGYKITSQERSTEAPVLCVHNGNLFIAWKGDGNDNLNVAIDGDNV